MKNLFKLGSCTFNLFLFGLTFLSTHLFSPISFAHSTQNVNKTIHQISLQLRERFDFFNTVQKFIISPDNSVQEKYGLILGFTNSPPEVFDKIWDRVKDLKEEDKETKKFIHYFGNAIFTQEYNFYYQMLKAIQEGSNYFNDREINHFRIRINQLLDSYGDTTKTINPTDSLEHGIIMNSYLLAESTLYVQDLREEDEDIGKIIVYGVPLHIFAIKTRDPFLVAIRDRLFSLLTEEEQGFLKKVRINKFQNDKNSFGISLNSGSIVRTTQLKEESKSETLETELSAFGKEFIKFHNKIGKIIKRFELVKIFSESEDPDQFLQDLGKNTKINLEDLTERIIPLWKKEVSYLENHLDGSMDQIKFHFEKLKDSLEKFFQKKKQFEQLMPVLRLAFDFTQKNMLKWARECNNPFLTQKETLEASTKLAFFQSFITYLNCRFMSFLSTLSEVNQELETNLTAIRDDMSQTLEPLLKKIQAEKAPKNRKSKAKLQSQSSRLKSKSEPLLEMKPSSPEASLYTKPSDLEIKEEKMNPLAAELDEAQEEVGGSASGVLGKEIERSLQSSKSQDEIESALTNKTMAPLSETESLKPSSVQFFQSQAEGGVFRSSFEPREEKSHDHLETAEEGNYATQIKAGLTRRNIELLDSLYSDSQAKIRLGDLTSLVTRCGGRILNGNTGSHFTILMPGGITGHSFRPHGKAHSSKLTHFALEGFRRAFSEVKEIIFGEAK